MTKKDNRIKLIIADDHKMMLEGLRDALSNIPDLNIVGLAINGREALCKAHKIKPDVIVMDISMPGLNGIEATRKFSSEMPDIKIVAISMHCDKHLVSQILNAGAHGFVLKECAVKELAHSIRTVMDGETYICSKMVKILVDNMVSKSSGLSGKLSSRERELLQLLAEGGNTKDIAEQMSVTTKTVESHRRRVMAKLGLHSVADLTKYALREGLTSLDY